MGTDYVPPSGLREVANTGVGGFALQNGTPTILTWTAPNDGKLHTVVIGLMVDVSSSLTGGEIAASVTAFGGGRTWEGQVSQSALGSGLYPGNGNNATAPQSLTVAPGGTVSLLQVSAVTAGAATVYATLLAD